MPHKSNSNCLKGATQRLSLSESARVSIHMYYILFFFYLLINNLLASLLSIFVEILFCKAKGQGPCH